MLAHTRIHNNSIPHSCSIPHTAYPIRLFGFMMNGRDSLMSPEAMDSGRTPLRVCVLEGRVKAAAAATTAAKAIARIIFDCGECTRALAVVRMYGVG
jgi:hypothetical protein